MNAWERRAAANKATLDRWKADNQARLGNYHRKLRDELEAVAFERIKQGREPYIVREDIDAARARIVSRMRLQRHGPDADGQIWIDQVNAIRAELGFPPWAPAPMIKP